MAQPLRSCKDAARNEKTHAERAFDKPYVSFKPRRHCKACFLPLIKMDLRSRPVFAAQLRSPNKESMC
jgi:hypothetical protein